MKFHYYFKHIDTSEALTDYANERLLRVCRFLLKDGKGEVYFSKGKASPGKQSTLEWKVDLTINSAEGKFAAHAKAESLYMALDMVADKLERQLLKRKNRVQHHKNYSKSRQGKLARVTDSLEWDHSRIA
ncbi:MAG: ribosome-associated translation inhibitor RaiA, partial [Pseudobdellovibrionaceae bacterium]